MGPVVKLLWTAAKGVRYIVRPTRTHLFSTAPAAVLCGALNLNRASEKMGDVGEREEGGMGACMLVFSFCFKSNLASRLPLLFIEADFERKVNFRIKYKGIEESISENPLFFIKS